ncbi:MAG: hypothetical protein SGPRY_008342 [Prymnesium sp.]
MLRADLVGEDALARMSIADSSVKRAALAQGGIIAGCYGATLLALQRNKPKYVSIRPARSAKVVCSDRSCW